MPIGLARAFNGDDIVVGIVKHKQRHFLAGGKSVGVDGAAEREGGSKHIGVTCYKVESAYSTHRVSGYVDALWIDGVILFQIGYQLADAVIHIAMLGV